MRKPIQLYDKTFRPLKIGDLLKMYHFKNKRRFYYMYKQVFKSGTGFYMAYHYPFNDPKAWFDLQSMATPEGILSNCEIIASTGFPYFYERKKLKIKV